MKPCLTETLIVMTKNDMIVKGVAFPIAVQIGTGSKITMKRTMRMKSIQRESLGIIMVLRGILAEIIKSRGIIE